MTFTFAMRARAGLIALCMLLLTACAGPQIFHTQLSALDKGMSQRQTASTLRLPPLSSHTVVIGPRSFAFDRYRINNGLQSDTYLLAYEHDGLVYWGYVAEFRRQPDAALSNAVGKVLQEVAAQPSR